MKMRTCKGRLIGLCVVALSLFAAAVSSPVYAQAPGHVRGRLLVKFREGVTPSRSSAMMAAYRVQEEGDLPEIGVKILSLPPNASEVAFERAFRARAEVEFAELDRLLPPDAITPNDPLYSTQWHLSRIAAPDAWSQTAGGSGIIIAILDTGVDGAHPDLSSKMVPGWNFYNDNADTHDVYGHGTKRASPPRLATMESASHPWPGTA